MHTPGPVACGNSVGAAAAFKEQLKSHNRNYIALDMESAGVLQACHAKNVDAVVVRVISDMADDKKEQLEQVGSQTEYAIRFWATDNLFRFLDTVFRRLLEFPGGPAQPGRSNLQDALHALTLRHFASRYRDFDATQMEHYERLFHLLAKRSADNGPWNGTS